MIYIDDAIHILQISEVDFEVLIQQKNIKVESSGLEAAISFDDFQVLINLPEISSLVRRAFRAQSIRRLKDESSGQNRVFLQYIDDLLIRYRAHLKTIESIHLKYNNTIKPFAHQTSESASYILIARSISLLRMAIDSIADKHFEAIILLRHIDESIALAEYFLIERNSEKGKSDLKSWFMENISPSYATCRDSIDKYLTSVPTSNDGPSMAMLMKRIYHGKSKPVHNAHHSIMETYNAQPIDDGLTEIGFDYGVSSNPRKLYELTAFYESSIWTLVQSMIMCFSALYSLLSKEDFQTLNGLNLEFYKNMEQRRMQ